VFAGHFEAATPIAAALPGAQGHKGDGAYIAPSENGFAVVIRRGNNLYSFVGDRQSSESFVARYGVDIYTVDNTLSLSWDGYVLGEMRRVSRASALATLFGSVLAVLAGAAWLLLAAQTASMNDEVAKNRQKAKEQVSGLIKDFSDFSIHPLHKSIGEIQTFVGKVIAIEGYMKYFQVDGSTRKWLVELPVYTTADVIERLGDKPVVTNNPGDQFITVEFDPSKKSTK
jgi:hypothetical protein